MSLPEFIFERIASDIRQQMTGILALTEQLARQRLSPDAQACASGVAESAAAVRRMLDAAFDLRAMHTEGLALAPAPISLRDLMDEIQEHWRPTAAMGGVTLLVSYDGDPELKVMADRRRLVQAFDGFIGEAVASARRGAVEASLKAIANEGTVRIEAQVRGGADADWSGRDLESRVRSVDSRFGLEVALGVALARQIVGDLGGELAPASQEGGGQSVRFELALPRAEDSPEDDRKLTTRPAHVLIVDDNATNRMVARALCEMFDCTCEAASDGFEAIDAVQAARFDLVLMDIKMPRMDGISAARAIRALPGAVGGVPIVALTANADPDDAAGYLAAGMDGVVEKPMKPEHLLAVLQQALDGAEAETAAV
ncbi:MAG TPA: response regulator [Phenylobacterium sp.]|uniref:response regulator n=1 Tax=Phenylobacterium sp. TaxID=1871053 RepID=UPI002C4DFB1F|nr:response regulator [Phenylobacterium sp.]HSV04093.1 response regulator [Phenylobacterium sp.]